MLNDAVFNRRFNSYSEFQSLIMMQVLVPDKIYLVLLAMFKSILDCLSWRGGLAK